VVASPKRLSERERSSLLRIGRVMTGCEFDDVSFALDADRLFASLDDFHQGDLRKALRIADGAIGGVLVLRPPRSLSALDTRRQTERFDRMRRSPLPFVRQIYAGLQRICVALYYSNPRNFADVQYPGPPGEASQ